MEDSIAKRDSKKMSKDSSKNLVHTHVVKPPVFFNIKQKSDEPQPKFRYIKFEDLQYK